MEKYYMTKVTSHKSQSQHMASHDDYRKVVHRPCSSCISSIQEITRTLSSFSCQLKLGVDLSCLS